MNCWLGDTTVPLPDLNTQDPEVQSVYGDWIENLVNESLTDGSLMITQVPGLQRRSIA